MSASRLDFDFGAYLGILKATTGICVLELSYQGSMRWAISWKWASPMFRWQLTFPRHRWSCSHVFMSVRLRSPTCQDIPESDTSEVGILMHSLPICSRQKACFNSAAQIACAGSAYSRPADVSQICDACRGPLVASGCITLHPSGFHAARPTNSFNHVCRLRHFSVSRREQRC